MSGDSADAHHAGDDIGYLSHDTSSADAMFKRYAEKAAMSFVPGAGGDGDAVRFGGGDDAEVKAQVKLGKDWQDCGPDESKQILEHLGKGEKVFIIKARGQDYRIDLTNSGDGKQINIKSNKERRLRLVEVEDPVDDPGVGDGDPSMSNAVMEAGQAGAGKSRKEDSAEVQQQKRWGAQSRRGGASDHPMKMLNDETHALDCFKYFEKKEEMLCGEWAAFYHSYSFAALIYEVHAAVGAVLFRFRSQHASLPRILVKDFYDIPDAPTLMKKFDSDFATNKRDHHPSYRKVGLSVMCSLIATGPEASPPAVFISGYSCRDLSFRGVLENILESCYVPRGKVKKLADEIIKLSEVHGLDVTQFGGKPCKSGRAGHILQIFIKRNLVDKLTYAAKPYGPIDHERMPISSWINSGKNVQYGQARVVAHPKNFLRATQVRMHVVSADPTFHRQRLDFQDALTKLLNGILGDPKAMEAAATGIYGGALPSWWTPENQLGK